ncbi:hypothetical protein [Haloterrigena turkmenica]|uniref:hypothetical protein n=1 Tax=Haloterrigena turkmenica TaxID=62320 RepID=UPI001650E944|nr:hypothetical protein [Haloterrigena turkmenica]
MPLNKEPSHPTIRTGDAHRQSSSALWGHPDGIGAIDVDLLPRLKTQEVVKRAG